MIFLYLLKNILHSEIIDFIYYFFFEIYNIVLKYNKN